MAASLALYGIAFLTLVGSPIGGQEENAIRADGQPLLPDREARVAGGRFLVENGALSLETGDERIPLETSDGEPTGEVRDLGPDPSGLLFVAAENGLYLTDVQSRILDRVPLGPGAPEGPPTSVAVDHLRRVWLATETDWGVIDSSFFWGRSLGEGEPGPFMIGISGDDEPIVRVQGPSSRTFTPSREALAVDEVTTNGVPIGSGDSIEKSYHDDLRIAARGDGELRWRIDGHHVWRKLEGEELVGQLSPGRHRIDVIAVGTYLDRSPRHSFDVEVAFPLYYDKRFVLVAGLVGAALAAAWFLRGERRKSSRSIPRALLSTVLLLVFAVQIVAGITQHARGWPFVGFSMYSGKYEAGDYVYRPTLRGIGPNGHARNIPFRAAGVAADSPWQVLRALIDGGDRAAREYLEAYNARFPQRPLVGLQACSERVRLTPRGGVEVAALVLSHYRAEEPPGGTPDEE